MAKGQAHLKVRISSGAQYEQVRYTSMLHSFPAHTLVCDACYVHLVCFRLLVNTVLFAFPYYRFVETAQEVSKPKFEGEEEEDYLRSLRENSAVWYDDVYNLALRTAESLFSSRGAEFRFSELRKEEKAEIKWRMVCEGMGMGIDEQSSFADTQYLYELFAIIMHRGSAHSGHYFAYIRDYQREGNWSGPDFLKAQQLAEEDSKNKDKKRENRIYFVDSDAKTIWVKANSSLSALVEVLHGEHRQTSTIGKLGTLIKKRTGKTWANGFKVTHAHSHTLFA